MEGRPTQVGEMGHRDDNILGLLHFARLGQLHVIQAESLIGTEACTKDAKMKNIRC